MLVIDELHNVLAGRSDKRREFLNLIRFLGNQLRIPLVGVGTREAYLAIRSDDQLENRFEPFVLPRWQGGRLSKRAKTVNNLSPNARQRKYVPAKLNGPERTTNGSAWTGPASVGQNRPFLGTR
jgi:Bacterial TniB protein